MKDTRICLGAFAGAHGVKGAAKVKTFTQSERGIADYGPVSSEDGARRFTLTFIRVLKPGLALVSAPEIANREDAAALAGERFYVERAALPLANADEFYIEDLVGLDAICADGAPLGRVIAVHNFGGGDILEISAAANARSLMIPFTLAAIPSVNISEGILSVAAAALEELTVDREEPSEGDSDDG